jgi:penicillin-binding protein 1A
MAWKDFMVAAHEGVPVRDLPGSWHPAPNQPAAPIAVSEDEDQTPLPTMRPDMAVPAPAAGRPAAPPVAISPPAEVPLPSTRTRPPLDAGRTASVARPVPPADVGGRPRRGGLSIMDVILGRD